MASEFGPSTRQKIFGWLRPRYHLVSQLTAASHFDPFVKRVDYLFRDAKQRKIGIVGRNLRNKSLAGIGAFAWSVSEGANFEQAEGTLNGVILVVLVSGPNKARQVRDMIANHVATQTPKTLVNDLVIGRTKDGKFEPVYLERAIF